MRRRRRRRSLLGALLFPLFIGASLMASGAWVALRSLGAPLPGIDEMWPIFPVLGGAAFMLGYLLNPKAFGLVLPGSAAILTGLFFFLVTLGPLEYDDLEHVWGVFPLIGGLAFVAMWMASFFRAWGVLIPGGLAIVVGVVSLMLTSTALGGVVSVVGWPVVLLAAGATLVLITLFGIAVRVLRLVAG